jgi:Ca2+-binding EF-hand superfamily protein
MSEMHKVFVNNGIQMNKEEVEKFFALCKTEVQGKLNF